MFSDVAARVEKSAAWVDLDADAHEDRDASGANGAGYGYWSVGAAYDLAPVSLALSYVNTTAEAKALFYDAAADNRWLGTIIWRF